MAEGRGQGRSDGEAAGAVAGEVSGRRVQLLAISAGQRLRSRLRREGRELDQAVRQRSAGADQHRQQDQVGAGDGAGHHRPRGVHLARPAHHPDRDRPRARRALRPGAGRHQCHRPHRDRRRQRRRPLRARQRPPFPDHRAAGAAIPPERGVDPEFADRRAGAERHHAGAAQRGRLHQAGVGRGLYLSRAAGALSADQVLGARARPRQRHPGSAAEDRRAGRNCRRARGSNGSASSAICRMRSSGCRSWCRSA